MPRGGQCFQSNRRCRAGELPPIHQKEYEAVRKAVEATRQRKDGTDRLKVIQLVLWDKSHTLVGAAMKVPCSERTAQEWHREFIRLVAQNFGLLE